MAERAMKGTHRECGCEICVKHDDTAICDFCKVAWPCDASIGRAALERIEALADGWRELRPGETGDYALVATVMALREIRDIARETQP